MILYLWHNGDSSTGIPGEQTEIDTCIPYDCWDDESIEWFREKMREVFYELWDFHIYAVYDFEMEELENAEKEIHRIMM